MLVTAGAWIRTWGGAYLRSEVVHDSAVHTERLVADGPYRHLRNPLYLGNMFLAVGMSQCWPVEPGGVVLILGNLLIVLRLIGREEAALDAGPR
jgi:protein-S-isoprenylcysteine O-methyltransferase Ste14